MKLLLVGDVHAVPSELDDCRALIELVATAAMCNSARVVFVGDQYNNHGLINSEVLWFWRDAFNSLGEFGIAVSALVGNHDYSGDGQTLHSMVAHEQAINVIDVPTKMGGVTLMPYYSDHEMFVANANAMGGSTLICHQTFTGADYGGGFYAPDGVDPGRLVQTEIVSGHIHTPQSFGKVTYIGAPRWRTLTDANLERAIWLYDFNDDGTVRSRHPFDTGKVCRQIRSAEDNPAFPLELPLAPGVDWRIDIKGPADWVQKRKVELAGPGVKIRTFVTSSVAHAVRESEGIGPAFQGYLKKYQPKHGTPAATLQQMAAARLQVGYAGQ